jgi:hypothetical protein
MMVNLDENMTVGLPAGRWVAEGRGGCWGVFQNTLLTRRIGYNWLL